MSAGICIMNRNAIAMAADSAVTVGDHAAIHNSANKLFSLSRLAPVGIIIYANASLMMMPVEIIVKQYKRFLADKTFDKLQEYVEDFVNYIETNSNLFRFDINEKDYIIDVFCDLMRGLQADRNTLLTQKKQTGSIDSDTETQINASAVQNTVEYVHAYSKTGNYCFQDYISDRYLNLFIEMLSNDKNYKWLSKEQVDIVCQAACEIFDTDFNRNGFLGIAIAGYGDNEVYPHMFHLHISGAINGKLRYYIRESAEITEKTPASIVPLAQTDVMQTFLFGINDSFLADLAHEIPAQISKSFDSIDDSVFVAGKREATKTQLTSVTNSILSHMQELARNRYMLPIIQSVATLPIEELALLAESMINITSLRRKVALDRNIGTVGGPIDVSIISKGDGFIWLKRKHYFDQKYNPQYLYSHYGRILGDE